MDGLTKATEDPQIKSIVIYGEGRTFPAGADIKEFETKNANQIQCEFKFLI